MKKFSTLAIILAILVVVSTIYAAEQIVEVTLTDDPVIAVDKNGNEYVRLIGDFDRELNGVKYTVGLPIMAFGPTSEAAKAYVKGDTLKAVCTNRKLQDGRESFSVITFIE